MFFSHGIFSAEVDFSLSKDVSDLNRIKIARSPGKRMKGRRKRSKAKKKKINKSKKRNHRNHKRKSKKEKKKHKKKARENRKNGKRNKNNKNFRKCPRESGPDGSTCMENIGAVMSYEGNQVTWNLWWYLFQQNLIRLPTS